MSFQISSHLVVLWSSPYFTSLPIMTLWRMGLGALLKSRKTTSDVSLFTELALSWVTKRLFALDKFLIAVSDHCLVIHEFGNGFHWICSITSSRTKVRLTSLQFPGSSLLFFVKMSVMFVFFQLPASSLLGMPFQIWWRSCSDTGQLPQYPWMHPTSAHWLLHISMTQVLSNCIFLYCSYCVAPKDSASSLKELSHPRADFTSFRKKKIKKA